MTVNHPARIPPRAGERLHLTVTVGEGAETAQTELALWHYRARPSDDDAAPPTASTAQGKSSSPRPRVLLIHGFRGDHHGMQVMVDALADYEVFVPDLPGFGETPPLQAVTSPDRSTASGPAPVEHSLWRYAQVVQSCAEFLGLGGDDVLLGHSFGSIVASAHVASSARTWKALVLAAPITQSVFSGPLLPGGAAVEAYYRAAAWLPEPWGLGLLRSRWALALTNTSMAVSWDPPMGAFIRDQHRKYFGGFSDRVTLGQAYRASSRFTAAQFASQLRLPVLLVAGARDQLSTPAGRYRMRDALPQGHLTTLRDTGHLLHYEKPAEAARAVDRFLRELALSELALRGKC